MKKVLIAVLLALNTMAVGVAHAQIVPDSADTYTVDGYHKNGALTMLDLVTSTGLAFPAANYESVAGAGTTVADAAALAVTKHIHQTTGANGTVGWKFTTGLAIGQVEFILNTTAGVPKIYGETGSTCNGGSVDAACTLTTGIMLHVCYKTAALTYVCS